MEITLEEDNPYVWNVVIFIQEGCQYDDGMFKCRLVFHDSFPEEQPRVQFFTPVFNVHVSNDGYIYWRLRSDHDLSTYLQALWHIFTTDPDTNPATHANSEAARLFLSDRREYNRRVRRCASDSVEY